jgi:hypothetical protein
MLAPGLVASAQAQITEMPFSVVTSAAFAVPTLKTAARAAAIHLNLINLVS